MPPAAASGSPDLAETRDDAGVAGLTLEELVARTGRGRRELEEVLRQEVRLGRVSCEDGRFVLCPGALPPEVAAALRGLSAPDVAQLRPRRRRSRGGRVSASERKNLSFVVY